MRPHTPQTKTPVSVLLKRRREERGLTIKELSAKTGISTGTISQVENGLNDPKTQTLLRLTRQLGLLETSLSQLKIEPVSRD